MTYQYKALNLSVKDIDDKSRLVKGYFASFNTIDSDNDEILPGAFKKSIQENGPESRHPRIKHMLDHRTDKVIGVIKVLKEDNFGLYYESTLGTHTWGNDAFKMYKDGIITEHSIGFRTIQEAQAPNGNHNQIKEVKLWEGSALQAWGANQFTPVKNWKGLLDINPEKVFDRFSKLTKALKDGTYTDETFELLEIEQKQIEQAIKDILHSKNEPGNNAHSTTVEPEHNWKNVVELFKI